jgi:hypothetical protein
MPVIGRILMGGTGGSQDIVAMRVGLNGRAVLIGLRKVLVSRVRLMRKPV